MNPNPRLRLLFAALGWLFCVSCDSRPSQNARPAPSTAARITVASLAPAATDLIVGMGAGDHLVAVSNFDIDRPDTPALPRVGDYQNTDWERLGDLRPSIIIVQMAADRVPAGFRDRAAALGAEIVDIQIENLADIRTTLDQLGAALQETSKANAAKDRLKSRLDAVSQSVARETPVRTFLALDAQGAASAGPGTFLDEVLMIAGGKNVLADASVHWPSIDKERLIDLSPDAIIQLLPGASPQTLGQATAYWKSLPSIPAVAHGQIASITDSSVLTPGIEVADLAEHIAAVLHPEAMRRAAN